MWDIMGYYRDLYVERSMMFRYERSYTLHRLFMDLLNKHVALIVRMIQLIYNDL